MINVFAAYERIAVKFGWQEIFSDDEWLQFDLFFVQVIAYVIRKAHVWLIQSLVNSIKAMMEREVPLKKVLLIEMLPCSGLGYEDGCDIVCGMMAFAPRLRVGASRIGQGDVNGLQILKRFIEREEQRLLELEPGLTQKLEFENNAKERKQKFDGKFTALISVINQFTSSSVSVKNGLFAGKLPRNLREIKHALDSITQGECTYAQGLRDILNTAKKMGVNHPIFLAARACIGLVPAHANGSSKSSPGNCCKICNSSKIRCERNYLRCSLSCPVKYL